MKMKQSINGPCEPDFYDDGTPIMTPYVRCKLTDEVIMAKGSDVQS